MKKIVVNVLIILYFLVAVVVTYALLSYNKYNIVETKDKYILTIKEDNLTTKNIEHYMLQCKAKNKEDVLINLLEIINPFLALIFVNSKEKVDELAMKLAEAGYRVGKLHGVLQFDEFRGD